MSVIETTCTLCTSSGGQLVTLQELWSVVSNAVKLDASSVDLWKVVTQQVCLVKRDTTAIAYLNLF